MFKLKSQKKSAFTLVEILIVIAILAILAVVTFVVIDPAARIQAANDARIREDVNGLADAISLYVVDNVGTLPQTGGTAISTLTAEDQVVAEGDDASGLAADLVPSYIAGIPTEPDGDQYSVGQTAAGIVVVGGTLSDATVFYVSQ